MAWTLLHRFYVMKLKIISPRNVQCNGQPQQLHTRLWLSKCNFLTHCGLHENWAMSGKVIPSDVLFVYVMSWKGGASWISCGNKKQQKDQQPQQVLGHQIPERGGGVSCFRERQSHDIHKHDKILLFSPPGNRAIFSTIAQQTWRKRKKSTRENSKIHWRNFPDIAVFCRFSWSSVSWCSGIPTIISCKRSGNPNRPMIEDGTKTNVGYQDQEIDRNMKQGTLWTNAGRDWNFQRTLSAIGPY